MVREPDNQKRLVSQNTRSRTFKDEEVIVNYTSFHKKADSSSLDLDTKNYSLWQWTKQLTSGKEAESLQDFDVKGMREKGACFTHHKT